MIPLLLGLAEILMRGDDGGELLTDLLNAADGAGGAPQEEEDDEEDDEETLRLELDLL